MHKITVYHAGVCFRAISRYRLWNAKPWLLGESKVSPSDPGNWDRACGAPAPATEEH